MATKPIKLPKDTKGNEYYPATTTDAVVDRSRVKSMAEILDEIDSSLGSKVDETMVVNDLTTGGADKVLSAEMGKEVSKQLYKKTKDILPTEDDKLLLTDSLGNVLAEFNSGGLSTTNVYIKNNGELVGIKEWIESMSNFQDLKESIIDKYKDNLYITDNEGNVLAKFNEKGLEVISITSPSILPNDWKGKILTTYGDSVTALQGGDFSYPYDFGQKWGNRVADYFKMSKHYGRGIGGQKYAWGTNGGSITWIEKDTGKMINRSDAYTLESWDGETFTSNVSDADRTRIINGLADGSVVSIRGCMCSWLRITSMYPASIKDTIDAVFVMCHNDGVDGKEFSWVEGDTTDPEWAASEQYVTYGGDYNINTLEGGIASTIMKLQAWLPNAVIILGTPINGQGTTGQLRPDANGLYQRVQHVKNVGLRFSIPVIDVYATCGINGLNRTDYITDTIHPYSAAGSKMIARAIIGGMKTILPNL